MGSHEEKPFDRPKLSIPRSVSERVGQALAIAGILACVSVLALNFSDLPEKIPQHFGMGGNPDAWSGQWSLWAILITNIVMFVGLSLVEKIPHYYNYAWPITRENAPRMYRLARELILWVKVLVVWMFTYIEWAMINVARGQSKGLGVLFLPIMLALLTVISIFFIVQMSRAK